MEKTYIVCISGELEYKRIHISNLSDLAYFVSWFNSEKLYHHFTLKEYESEDDICIDCYGKDVFTLTK